MRKSSHPGHGGARPGAGRPPIQLRALIAEGRFRWKNQRHRQLLAEDTAPLDLDGHAHREEIESFVEAYRRAMHQSARAKFAKQIEERAADPEGVALPVISYRNATTRVRGPK